MAGSRNKLSRMHTRLLLLLATLGWLGVGTIILNSSPTFVNLLAFFGLLYVALVGTISPLAAVWHARFAGPQVQSADRWRPIREGALVSLFLITCLWLQMNRALDWASALLMFGAVVLIEAAVLVRRS